MYQLDWQEVSLTCSTRPQNLWGIKLVSRYPNDNQFLAYDPNSRTQWMFTVQGLIGRWDTFQFKGFSKNCVYHLVEPQFPQEIINNNKPKMISRGNLRGRIYNRSVMNQTFKPTSKIVATKSRGECVFSHGGAYFHLDYDIEQPIVRRLPISGQSSAVNSSNSKNLEAVSNYRRKWSTCVCFGQTLMCYGGSVVDISQNQPIFEANNKIQFASVPLLLYRFSNYYFLSNNLQNDLNL